MHFQFVNWKYYQFKQAWYMCHSAISNEKNDIDNKNKSLAAINRMHFFTYFENFPKVKKISISELRHIPKKYFKNINFDNSKFWKKKFNFFFQKNNIENFEELNIWHIPFLQNIFLKKTNRLPKKKLKNKLIFFLFIILEIIRNFIRIFKNET